MKSKCTITKEEHQWTSEEKIKWCGYGEWVEEVDIMEFEYKGIKCLISRVYKREPYTKEETFFGGHLCGYIFLPKDHPFYGKDIYDISLDCHGGITFSQETEEGYMVGFDCAHSGDLIPSMDQLRKRYPIPEIFPTPEEMEDHPWFKTVYRNMAYCVKECKNMAKQAVKMKTVKV